MLPIREHTEDVNSAAFDHGGNLIVTASDDRTVRVFSGADGSRHQWLSRDSLPFSKRLFAVSAVSGGALGAAVTYAALADRKRGNIMRDGSKELDKPPCSAKSVELDSDWFGSEAKRVRPRQPHKSWSDCLQLLVAGDFLSPVFISMLSNDLPRIALRGSRADILELAWEARYARLTGQADNLDDVLNDERKGKSTLAQGLTRIRSRNPDSWLPVLLLNGTSVETGRRIVTSDVDTQLRDAKGVGAGGVFRDAFDLHAMLTREEHPTKTMRGHSSDINGVALTPDAKWVVTGSDDGTARVWDANTGAELAVLEDERRSDFVYGVAVTPDATRIVTGSKDRTARVWGPRSGPGSGWQKLADLKGHTGSIHGVAITADGARIVTGSYDGTARIWEPRPGPDSKDWKSVAVLEGHTEDVNGVAMTPDGSLIVTASDDETARVWMPRPGSAPDAKDWHTVAVLKGHEGPVWSAAVTPDGTRIVTGSNDTTARVWDHRQGSAPDARDWHAVAVLKGGHAMDVKSVALAADGGRIVTGSDDGTARVWEPRSGSGRDARDWEPVDALLNHTSIVWGVAMTPDGSRIVTGSWDSTARVWKRELESGRVAWRTAVVLEKYEYEEPPPPCDSCDIRLSTAVTMSARFPIISPAGSIRHGNKIVDWVVDGGYYENFGATTAFELARYLGDKTKLRPKVLLINNEPTVPAMECVDGIKGPEYPKINATPWFPTFSSPLGALVMTRTARGTHAAATLCAYDEKRFAHIKVWPDPKNPAKELSMSWWMSKHVQKRLDEELGIRNAKAFEMARSLGQR
jgi:WD40 repeat protein